MFANFFYHVRRNERLAREYREVVPVVSGSAALGAIPLVTIFANETANALHRAMTAENKSLEMRTSQDAAVACGTITTVALVAMFGPAVLFRHLSRLYSHRAAENNR